MNIGDGIYIGMPWPFNGVDIEFGTVSTAETLAFQVWNGVTFNNLTVEDGTSSFTANGAVLWSTTGELWENWVPSTIKGETLYWLRIRPATTIDATATIRKVRTHLLPHTTNSTTMLTPQCGHMNGLTVFRDRSGRKHSIVGFDSTGMIETWSANNQSWFPFGYARLCEFDETDGDYTPLQLPASAMLSGPSAQWSFAVANGTLIATNGYGPPVTYDGRSCAQLKAAGGTDTRTSAYLSTPPWGRFLALHESALYSAGGYFTPQTVFHSNVDGDSDPGLAAAPVGGANLWRSSQNFDTGASDSDVITGLASNGYVLTIFKNDSIWQWDGGSIRKAVNGTGCIAPASIATVGTSYIFLGSEGVFLFDGSSARPLSAPVEHFTLNRYTPRPWWHKAVGVRHRKTNTYRLWMYGWRHPVQLVLNYTAGTWTKHGNITSFTSSNVIQDTDGLSDASCAFSFEDELGEEHLLTGVLGGGVATPRLQLREEDYGYVDFRVTNAIGATTSDIPTALLVFNRGSLKNADRKLFRYTRFLVDGTGWAPTAFQLYNNSNWRGLTATTDSDALDLSESGDGQWTENATRLSDTAREARPIWIRLSMASRRNYHQLVLIDRVTSGAVPFRLYGYEVNVRSQRGRL